MRREELKAELMELLEGLAHDSDSWQPGEVEEVADYILARGGLRTARELVERAAEGDSVVNDLVDWINAWYFERSGTARSKMVRVYLRTWEWHEVDKAVQLLLRHRTAPSKAAALGLLALIGARVLNGEGLQKAVSLLATPR